MPEARRSAFLGRVALVMLAVAAGTTLMGCGGSVAPQAAAVVPGQNEPPGWDRPLFITVAGAIATPTTTPTSRILTREPYDRGVEED